MLLVGALIYSCNNDKENLIDNKEKNGEINGVKNSKNFEYVPEFPDFDNVDLTGGDGLVIVERRDGVKVGRKKCDSPYHRSSCWVWFPEFYEDRLPDVIEELNFYGLMKIDHQNENLYLYFSKDHMNYDGQIKFDTLFADDLTTDDEWPYNSHILSTFDITDPIRIISGNYNFIDTEDQNKMMYSLSYTKIPNPIKEAFVIDMKQFRKGEFEFFENYETVRLVQVWAIPRINQIEQKIKLYFFKDYLEAVDSDLLNELNSGYFYLNNKIVINNQYLIDMMEIENNESFIISKGEYMVEEYNDEVFVIVFDYYQ